MQDAGGLFGVGGEVGEEESWLAVAEDHTALPTMGVPATQFPRQACYTVGTNIIRVAAAVDEVTLDGLYRRLRRQAGRRRGGKRRCQSKASCSNGVEGGDKGFHTEVFYHRFHLAPVDFVLQGAAGERPVDKVTQRDAAGGEVTGHVAKDEEDLESGERRVESGEFFEQGFVAAVAGGIVGVEEVVVALHGDATEFVASMVVRMLIDLDMEFSSCHLVGFRMTVVEVEVQITEFAQLRSGIVLSQMCPFEYEGLDTMSRHQVK